MSDGQTIRAGVAHVEIPNDKPFRVLRCGTQVKLGPDQSIDAVITGVSIRGDNRVTYEAGWWDGRTHNSIWLEDFEVEAISGGPAPQKQTIGFK